ncbi:MAG: hydantoinase/oxoprolinase N-terminal domain-containing protein [Pseudomonadales bacterium]
MNLLLGVDTGGTFTDFVLLSVEGNSQAIRIHKLLSTPAAPEQAILQGIDELGLTESAQAGKLVVIHGSTIATNAALEGKGVRTLFITNRGFSDMLTLGRQTRRELYNLQPPLVTPPVPKALCLETGGRLTADGEVLEDLSQQDLEAIKTAMIELKPEAVAINLLFSFLDDRFEKAIEDIIPEDIFTARSSFVLPEYKEYERGMATWLNAWLGPLVERYLQNLQQSLSPSPVAVMQSSGGTPKPLRERSICCSLALLAV